MGNWSNVCSAFDLPLVHKVPTSAGTMLSCWRPMVDAYFLDSQPGSGTSELPSQQPFVSESPLVPLCIVQIIYAPFRVWGWGLEEGMPACGAEDLCEVNLNSMTTLN